MEIFTAVSITFVQGFLEAHQIKRMGFLELGIKTGQSQCSGQTAQVGMGRHGRVRGKVNVDYRYSMAERERLQTRPGAQGFTRALVQSITRVTPLGESYKLCSILWAGEYSMKPVIM